MKHKWICSKAPQTSPVPSRPDWKLTDFTKRTMLLLSILASTRHQQPIQWPVFQYRANKYNNLMIAITDVRGHIYFTDIYPKNLVLYAGAVLGGLQGGQCPLSTSLAPLNLDSYHSKQFWVKCTVCPVNTYAHIYIYIRKTSPAAKFKSAFAGWHRERETRF